VTTFGVGELSLLNAIAGAYSEYVSVVHIVGQPSTISQRNGMLLHHTLGNGDFNVFANMSAGISCAVAKLNDQYEAATLIDNALRECWIQSRPVYITLPTDIVQKKIEGERLDTPIDLSYPPNEVEREDYVVDVVLKYLAAAKNPVILVDACAVRHRALDETHDLIQKSKLPVFVTPMGKSAVDETLPNYGGVFAGDGSNPGVKERLESADLVLSIGAVKSDFNTTGFTYRISQLNTIDFHSTMMRVRYSEYPGVGMKGVLRKVTDRLPKLNVEAAPPVSQNKIPSEQKDSKDSTILHAWFWPRMGQWLKEDDIIVTETGTANFGIWETRFPKGVVALSQVLWGSIGYSVGACQGAALAAKETGNRRTLLFVGDGSFQLTAQEVSTMIRHDLKPIIFCICNEGYTIERYIHGMDASYNDVQEWKYKDLVTAFGAKPDKYKTYQVKTRQELEALFHDEKFSSAPYLQFVELYMPKEDAPTALKITAEASAKTNAKM
jgi:pyruvate decarboxylase